MPSPEPGEGDTFRAVAAWVPVGGFVGKMARWLTYAEQTHDSPNPLARFAHRSRYKASVGLADKYLPVGGMLVDFGAGEGTFLRQIGLRRPDARLLAIEPYQSIDYSEIAQVPALADIEPHSVDVVTAIEVLEHLTEDEVRSFLTDAQTVLKPGGKLVVSVPIMYGLALPVKDLSRSMLHRRRSDTSLVELLKATTGIRIARTTNLRGSHKGFDFRQLRDALAAGFRIMDQRYSPFPRGPWWVNSQALFVAD